MTEYDGYNLTLQDLQIIKKYSYLLNFIADGVTDKTIKSHICGFKNIKSFACYFCGLTEVQPPF